MKLEQKQFLKGSRSFHIDGDTLVVQQKSALRQEKLNVILAVINPDPVVEGPLLVFQSRVNSEPLFSLLRDKPDERRYNEFVELLKRRVREEYSEFTGLRSAALPEGLAANSYDEPPDFDTPPQTAGKTRPVSAASIENSIRMLREHLDGDDLASLLDALQALKSDPQNPARFSDLVNAFEDLGQRQGAVLTYAPYLSILLSDDPFAF